MIGRLSERVKSVWNELERAFKRLSPHHDLASLREGP